MKRAYVAGTFDTKARELAYIAECLKAKGVAVTLVDLSTSGAAVSGADISAATVATFHPVSYTHLTLPTNREV